MLLCCICVADLSAFHAHNWQTSEDRAPLWAAEQHARDHLNDGEQGLHVGSQQPQHLLTAPLQGPLCACK